MKKLLHKTKIAAFRLSPEQYKMIEARAASRKVPMAVWMRSILSQAAENKPDGRDGFVRVREPNGEMF